MQAHLITANGIKRLVSGMTGGSLHIVRDELTLRPAAVSARYHGGRWRVLDTDYSIVRIESPVTVHLRSDGNRSATYGPFSPLLLVDGVLLSDGSGDAIAQLDLASHEWIEQSTQTRWDQIVVTAA